jgi:hypothetical protein
LPAGFSRTGFLLVFGFRFGSAMRPFKSAARRRAGNVANARAAASSAARRFGKGMEVPVAAWTRPRIFPYQSSGSV